MDDLPNQNNQNTPPTDWSQYSGKYPDEVPPPQPKPPSPPLPVEPEVDPFPGPGVSPSSATTPIVSTVVEPFPASSSPSPSSSVPPTEPVSFNPPQPANETVPPPPTTTDAFVQTGTPESPPKKAGGSMVKRLLIILLLIGFLVLGYFGFKFLGGMLAKRGPITLTYWGLWENEDVLAPILAEYKETHPNIEISYAKQSPKQYRERLQAAIERGEGPDMFRFHNTWVPMLKADLAAAGTTGYTASDFQQTFYPVAASDLVIDGNVYGVPLMIDGLGLYYNEDLLQAAGVAPPKAWDEFRNSALQLTVKDAEGRIVTAGAAMGAANNIEHFSDVVALLMLQNGVNLSNPTTKEAYDAISFYHLFVESGQNVWDENQDNSILAFAGGRVAMIFAPSWQAHEISVLNPNLKFKIIPVPQLPGGSITWASYWVEGVSAKSEHQTESWEFLKFLSSKESLIILYTEASKTRAFGEPYSRVDLAQTVATDPFVGAYIQQAPTAKTFFLASRTFDNGINDKMIQYLTDGVNSLSQGVSQQAALETTAQGFQQVLSSYGLTTSAP